MSRWRNLWPGGGSARRRGLKKISYSLFEPANPPSNEKFVFDKYLLGVYFNARMNRLLYPGWQTVVYADERLLERHGSYFAGVAETCGAEAVAFVGRSADRPLWELVLSRLVPLFDDMTTHLACRDLDSIGTYREAR